MTGNYKAIFTAKDLRGYVDKLIADDLPFGFDIESGYTGADRKKLALQPYHPDWILVGVSFTNNPNWARYVPIAHDNAENVDDVYTATKELWRMLQTGNGVAHNTSFELAGLGRHFRDVLWDDAEVGEAVRASKGLFPFKSDSLLEAFVYQGYAPQQQGGPGLELKPLVQHIFGNEVVEFKDLFPEEDSELGPGTPKAKMQYIRFNSRTLAPKILDYVCADSVYALKMHQKHYAELQADKRRGFILNVELKLLPVLAEMEIEGLELDWLEFERRTQDTGEFLGRWNEDIQSELSERLGELVNVNFGSSQQVAKLLYERLGYPVKYTTDSGAPSTDEKALRSLAKKDDAVKRILEYREIKKLHTSYLKKYVTELSYATDGRAHPNHKQHGAATGRMSVDHVSYQQWPKPYHYELKDGTTYDLNFRNFLVSPADYRIVGYDFSQVELRVLAGMANEEGLLKAFNDGVDIHKATASLMMGIPLEEVTDKDRSKGKTLNFAIVYGSGAANIGELLGISTDEAQALLDQYFRTFKGLKAWMDARVKEGVANGYVETHFGRRFRVWEYEDHRPFIQAKGDRMCVNAPVQGGAADYMKIGMVRVNKAIKDAGLQDKVRLVMTIHDALEFYVHESVSTQEVIDLINPEVSFPIPGLPEIRADWHEGTRWGEVFEIELDERKQITGYSFKVELPDKSKHKWAGSTFDAVNDQFQAWKDAGNVAIVKEKATGVAEARAEIANEMGVGLPYHILSGGQG